MKTYDFAWVSASEYPTVEMFDYLRPWIGVSLCINVSEKPYPPEIERAMKAHAIEYHHFPLSEEVGADWMESFASAVSLMYYAHRTGRKQIIHSDLGENRSQAVVEALYFPIIGKEFNDPYRGARNHLEFNCKAGHLPDLEEIERRLEYMANPICHLWRRQLNAETIRKRFLANPSAKKDYIKISDDKDDFVCDINL